MYLQPTVRASFNSFLNQQFNDATVRNNMKLVQQIHQSTAIQNTIQRKSTKKRTFLRPTVTQGTISFPNQQLNNAKKM
ncbi:hypothetical protein CDL15_Pgr006313 [Punica granatum]|uniref:Uncharacterized protein n=1 Tax=Punica granatum TaxID=22663 RepID=A0A218WAG9_PUNGR|nr:hypothetical protein CDL15_Pgr006313 [Punica granatum]